MASKTARRSSRIGSQKGKGSLPKKADQLTPTIIPLNKGRHAYVIDPIARKTRHVRTDSDAFIEAVRPVVRAGKGQFLRQELLDLGWVTQLAFLDASDVFDEEVLTD